MATSTFYPDANPESASVDGQVNRTGVDETWATIRGNAGTAHDDASVTNQGVGIIGSTTNNQWTGLYRGIYLFDTSGLPDDCQINSAVFSVFVHSGLQDDFSESVGVVSSNPAANTDLVNADFTTLGTARYATDKTLASLSSSSWANFTLNAAGIATINKTGITKFGLRLACDIDNSAPTWSSEGESIFLVRNAEYETNIPKLVMTIDEIPTARLVTKGLTSTFQVKVNISAITSKLVFKGFPVTLGYRYGWVNQSKNTATPSFQKKHLHG